MGIYKYEPLLEKARAKGRY